MKDIPPKTYIYGKHALMEALRNSPHAVEKVLLAPQGEEKEIRKLAQSTGVPVEDLSPKTMPHDIDSSAVHQGVIGLVSLGKLVREYRELIDGLKISPDSSLVILGAIQDPQNVGAIIRS